MNDNNPDNLIALLDDDTANRIAAGEVVERPSSVVKELLENALDAEASRIEVELTEGGKRKIVVRDNGTGMSATDAILSLQRHATSKIRSAEDLFAIYTFGFRGEALPSIASVSDFRIVSKRQQDEIATEIIVRHGEIVSVEAAAAPTGTTITVEKSFSHNSGTAEVSQGDAHRIEQCRRLAASPPTRTSADGVSAVAGRANSSQLSGRGKSASCDCGGLWARGGTADGAGALRRCGNSNPRLCEQTESHSCKSYTAGDLRQ